MSKPSFEVVDYSPELDQAYQSLLPEQNLLINKGKVKWKLKDHPTGPGLAAICRSNNGEIIGLTSFQSTLFTDESDQTFLGYQAMDTVIHPESKIPGALLHLIHTFYKSRNSPMVMGFPNPNSSPFFFGRLNWRYLGAVPMMWRPLRTGFILNRLGLPAINLPIPRLPHSAKGLRKIELFEPKHERSWRALRALKKPKICVERTPEILNWRFAENPSCVYDLWEFGSECIAVSYCIEKHGSKLLYLCEVMGNIEDMASAVKAIISQYGSQKPDVIFAWAIPGSPVHAALKKAGLFDLPEKRRPITINFGAHAQGGNRANVPDMGDWHLSYFDSDTV